jgi:phenylpropionate dioxygenase-like ring-hydroxylating dioxygenase large terminal subunit
MTDQVIDRSNAPHIQGLTEGEAAGIEVFEKPDSGSWTSSFGLDTDPVSFRDSFDPAFYELEKEAVFRRSWLNLGRVEQLPRRGSYFTKELKFLGISVIVVRGMDEKIRAFHNVCSHRGNRLVWDDYPDRETRGMCRAFSCKYHGWRYTLDGQISYVHNAPEFFDLNAEELALPQIHLDTWAGFIWINLDETPRQSLRDFLTPTVAKLETYPFEKMTQTYVFQSEVEANWKLFVDAFQEVYHVPYVHGKLNNPAIEQTGVDKIPFMIPYWAPCGKHRLFSSVGALGNANLRVRKAADALFRAGLLGTDYTPDVGPLGDGVNPGGIDRWGADSWQIYPNFVLVTWSRNHYFTYRYWPLSPTRHKFEWTVNFVPPTTTRERLAQEHAAMVIREGGLQDAATLEATQMGIASGARKKFFLCDQEVAIRHLHSVVQDDVAAHAREAGLHGSGTAR